MKRFFAAALLFGALGASPALADQVATTGAETSAQERLIVVQHGDLDLSQQDDAAALLSRLRYAAMRACEVSAIERPGASLRRQIRQCQDAALGEAVAETNAPAVAQLYSEQQR